MSKQSLQILLLATVLSAGAVVAQTSAPPAAYAPKQGVGAATPATLLLPADAAPATAIVLAEPTAAEKARLIPKAASSSTKSAANAKRRLAIGFARDLPAARDIADLSKLQWTVLPDGGRAARIAVTSPGAAALRIALVLHNAPAGLRVRFAGSSGNAVFGPYTAAAISEQDPYWSPVLDGETATVELALPAGAALGAASVVMPMLSHLVAAGAALKQSDPLRAIGEAGSCEIDVACLSNTVRQQAANAINAVARVVLTDFGQTYVCSGTLLNDSLSSSTPYFYTANHCFDDDDNDPAASKGNPAAAATSVNTYWFFQSNACGADTAANVNYTVVTGGAQLLGRSVDYDWTLLLLRSNPPAGATFAAWNAAAPLATGAAAAGIHHPAGDLKKFSQGNVQGYHTYQDGSTFVDMLWSQGVTEQGSSGSGLFTYNASGNYYELRGGLYGGDSSCSVLRGIDHYSRLDVALPLLAKYLTPDAPNTARKTLVVEYYAASLDDYFITADAAEIQGLDAGVHPGWVRTGLTFLAYADPSLAPAGASPVCRFYVLPQAGDSHFYSADPAECAATATRFAGTWQQESPALFYIQVPNHATGACPAGTRPVYRFLKNSNGLHHRYTAEVDVRNSTVTDGGWTQEGYGALPSTAVMCTPTI